MLLKECRARAPWRRCCLPAAWPLSPAGLQPLAPYLVKLIWEGVGAQLKSLPHLALLLR